MKKPSIVIIGQGLAGTILGLHCAQYGIDFTIWQSPQFSTPSTIAAGLINPITGKRLTKSWNIDKLLPYAKIFYSQAETHLGKQFLNPRSLLRILKSEEEALLLKKRLSDPTYTPYIGTLYPPNHFEHLQNNFGSFLINQVHTLSVPNFLNTAKNFFQANNQWVAGNFDASEISHTLATHIIFCEGYRSVYNPYFQWLPFRVARGDILTLKLDRPISRTILNKEKWILPIDDTHIKIGATYDWTLEQAPNPLFSKTLIQAFCQTLQPQYQNYISIEHASDIRPCTQDAKPFIGLHPQHSNIGIFNGFGSKGTLMIPYYADQFIQHIIHNHPLDSAVDIHRHWKL